MKTPTLLASATLLAASTALAGFRSAPCADYKPGEISFAGSFDFAVVAGEANEHVFAPKASAAEYAKEFGLPYEDRRHQLSRLDWDLAAAMIGFSGSVRYDRFSFNGGVWGGGSGSDDWEMKDYDWMNGDRVNYTDYSRSDTEITTAWMLDANVSFDFCRAEDFAAYLFAGMRWQQWEWECAGRNDYLYAEQNGKWYSDNAHVCDYRQTLYFAYIGIGGTWKLTETLDLSAYLSWAPAYAGEDHDEHLAAEKDFKDTFDYDGGNVYAGGVTLGWHVAEHATLSFSLDWQKATLHEGDLKLMDYSYGEYSEVPDGAGIKNEYVALSCGLTYAF